MEGGKGERVAQHSQPSGILLQSQLRAFDLGKQTVNFEPHGHIHRCRPPGRCLIWTPNWDFLSGSERLPGDEMGSASDAHAAEPVI